MTNHSDIKEKARGLYLSLLNLREALLQHNEEEREILSELEEITKILYFYSIFSPSPIFTVVGSQGVGKSQMVNTLLNLKKEEALPVGEERCERIPILLLPTETKETEAEAYKWSSITKGEMPTKESSLKVPVLSSFPLSYEEARKRAINPSADDAIIFWYIKDNPILERIGQLVVLPGFELKAPWEDALRCILSISDVIIYTCDWRRKAQASSEKIEEWIKEADIPYDPILVFTKSDIMTKDQKESVKEVSKPYEILFVGTGEGSVEEYENLWRKISENLVNPSPRRRVFKFKNLLSKIGLILNKIEKIAKRKEAQEMLTTSRVLDEYISFLDAEWEKVTRTLIISQVESILKKRIENSLKYGRKIAKREFQGAWEKIKLWLAGGPDVEKIIRIENTLKKNFLKGLDKEIAEKVSNEVKKLKVKVKEKETKINWTTYTFLELLTTPLPKLEYKMNEIVEDIKKAREMSKELAEFVRGGLEDARKIGQEIAKFRELVASDKKDILLPSVGVAGGTGTFIGEITGIIKATAAGVPSIIVGAVGFAVAAVSFSSIILRRSRQMEWEIEKYIREYTSQMYQAIKNRLIIKLDECWEIIKFNIKKRLTELMGLNKEIENRIFLYTTLKDAKEKLINIEKEIL